MNEHSCQNWTKATDKAGYGVSWLNGKYIRAHRKIWIETYGEIPQGFLVCHSCDNRACININHLFLGTPKDNSKDMVNKKRQAVGEATGNSKLVAKQVVEILHSNESSRQIAKKYNISKTNVLDIKNNKIWKHLNAN